MSPEPTIDVEAFKKFERERFSSVAHGYDRATATVTSQVNDAILDAVEAGTSNVIAGCRLWARVAHCRRYQAGCHCHRFGLCREYGSHRPPAVS